MKRLIMATMVTAILASSTVWAADNAPVAAQQQTQQVQQTQKTAAAAERISEQGLYAMRDVQVARLALFHGDPEKAKELTNEASALLSDDSTEWAKFAKPGKKTNLNDDQYIVINASVGISESYVATPEKEAAIKIANEKMAKGDKKGAMEELRLAGVGVMENHVVIWMTDGWPLYESRLKGKLHVISKRYTQRIERHNLNLRQHLARLGRKSLSFSKSVELHDKVIGHYLNIKHYQ
ncbi:hypothetical protein BT09C10_03030 [Escherichia coli]